MGIGFSSKEEIATGAEGAVGSALANKLDIKLLDKETVTALEAGVEVGKALSDLRLADMTGRGTNGKELVLAGGGLLEEEGDDNCGLAVGEVIPENDEVD